MALRQAKVLENGKVVNTIMLDESQDPAEWNAVWDESVQPIVVDELNVLEFIANFKYKVFKERKNASLSSSK
jgi:hypothetical protein